jgi:hypothetical protein
MALVSPGLEITVTDESQYVPGAVGTVPLVVFATEQDKIFNGTIADGTTATNAGKLQAFTSQRELVAAMGYPTFKQSAAGTPLHGNEQNEYGLMAAYSAMGLGNRIYAIRADIDLGQLDATSVRPVGAVTNGIYWFDLANSSFGINEWDAVEETFTIKTPLVLTSLDDLVVGPPYSPKTNVGDIGSYAVVAVDDTTNGAANFVWYKDASNTWVRVGTTAWQQSWPAVTGTEASPTLTVGTNILKINNVNVTISGTDLASVVTAINSAVGLTGVTAAASSDSKLNIFVTSAAQSNGSVTDGKLSITNGTGSLDVLLELGIEAAAIGADNVYAAPILTYGTYVQIPSWRASDTVPRPSGSIFLKTTATGNGASLAIKIYSSSSDTWTTLAAPLYESEEAAIYGLDATGGGNGIGAGSVFVQYDVRDEDALSMKFFVREVAGAVSKTGTVPTSTPSFNSAHTITMRVTQPASNTATSYTFAVGGTTSAAFVAAILSRNIPNVSARLESNGAITIIHRTGGVIYLSNASGTALTTAGFTSSTTGVRTRTPGGTELVLSNFAELDYTYSTTEPYEAPADGTLWYYGNPLDVDILVCETNGWKGYRNVPNDARGYNLQNTNPDGPILSASEPTLQTDGTALVAGDLWIDTGDLENFPSIYRYNGVSFIAIDNTDAISQNGIVFADARWDSDGTTDPVTGDLPDIAGLLESNYTDLDAPNYQLFPRGTLLFNTRRSGYNIKRYVSNLFTETNFPDDALPDVPATWVTASGNKNNGSPYMGRQAQRRMIVTAMRGALTASTEIREERFDFSLICAPGYPELISDMVALNNDRRNTAFVIGDTPLNLPANVIQLTNWSEGIAGVYGDGLTTADPYLGVFYPACATTDVQGNEIVQPASHMALRTFIRSDNVSFQWFPPAGTRRGLIDNATNIGFLSTSGSVTTFIQTGINQSLRDAMYPININPMTVLPGVGLVCFGQKTRNPFPSSLDRINVARLVNYIRTILAGVGNGFLFEPNDKITRDQLKQIIEGALNDLVAKRGVYDYLVVCDSSNNTPDRIARNELYVDIAIEPMKDVEFIYIPIRLKNPGDIEAGV